MASITSADIGSDIKSINKKSNMLNRCMDDIENHYRIQITTLDTVLVKLRNTSDYLSNRWLYFNTICVEK